jgi:thiol-disulfide isomerase/thioredoxin|tara:strand:+ start:610 stop:918 length:309 start_codon:yes stop_codon:yes gene_type:complete
MDVISGDECYTKLDNEGYILYYFTASWCGPCQRIWEDFQKMSGEYENILFFKIDISDEENTEICEKCNIDSVPSFLLFKDRNYIERITGANLQSVGEMLNKY